MPEGVVLLAGKYRHYKGGQYQVLGIGEHTETGERLVVYVALTGANLPGPRIRLRPVMMFIGVAENGQKRFVYEPDLVEEGDGSR
jgi:hypothetical protein